MKNIKEVVNTDSGEIIHIEKSYVIKDDTEGYYVTFKSAFPVIMQIKSIRDFKVLHFLCDHAAYGSGYTSVFGTFRDYACKKLGISTSDLSKSIKRLKDLRLIIGGNGSYEINPKYFWKGTTRDRNNKMNGEKKGNAFRNS